MKIYTRGGDKGETSLCGGLRVHKDSAYMEACGAVDELNAALGMVRTEPLNPALDQLLAQLQQTLFQVGAELGTPRTELGTSRPDRGPRIVGTSQIEALERSIDEYQERLPELRSFILPTGTRAAAALHLARTICRRAERRVVTLSGAISPELIAYLNRLSDLLFVLARTANADAGVPDAVWVG